MPTLSELNQNNDHDSPKPNQVQKHNHKKRMKYMVSDYFTV